MLVRKLKKQFVGKLVVFRQTSHNEVVPITCYRLEPIDRCRQYGWANPGDTALVIGVIKQDLIFFKVITNEGVYFINPDDVVLA
jgi:hypothetical protein